LLLFPFPAFLTGFGLTAFFYGCQLIGGEFHALLCLFGIPFITVGSMFCFQFLRWSFGNASIIVEGDKGTVREGIGRLGWKRHFCWRRVSKVYKSRKWFDRNGRPHSQVVLVEGEKLIAFGSWPLCEAERNLIVLVLRTILVIRDKRSR
jgi:hypothetical protein